MYRVAAALAVSLSVAPHATAQTQSLCGRIAQAEALGIVAEPGMAPALAENWQMTGIQGPVVTYLPKNVQSGDTVAALVEKGGFLPDRNNIAFTQALNPGKTDLNTLGIGEALNVPSISSMGEEDTSIDGYKTWTGLQVALSAETSKQEAVAKIETVGAKLDTLSGADSVTGRIRRDITMIGDLINSPMRVQSNGAIGVDEFVLLEQKSGAYQAAEYVSGLFEADQIELYPAEQIAVITDAVTAQVAALGIGRAEFVVRTYSPTYEQLTGLRVYRATEASHRAGCQDENKIEFDTRSFQARTLAPVAKWWFWAEDAAGRKSKARSIDLRSGGRDMDYTIEWAD
ncbi:hypothetical protein [Nitratireductor pacificus]|uniref:Uncharacterized protein n=1 Tax=Nitratireductor pacificus pht-3B TaxID=391937 RepID=K2N3C6_9HYPH|nr:hypothetical protein [Nitratireductor pacificus]EKF18738.1 hypothetical protein NA2_11160 [Nitratireductor pacificus pht-3B]